MKKLWCLFYPKLNEELEMRVLLVCTILDILINFLRTLKNVLKKISFLNVPTNVQISHIQYCSFTFTNVHEHSLMLIYIHLCSKTFIIVHINEH